MDRTQSTLSTVALAVLAAALPGCAAASARFTPAGASAARRDGAVHYDLEASGAKLGDAKVWTAGAQPAGAASRAALLHVGLRVRNASPHRFRLDLAQTGVELLTRDGRLLFVDDAVRAFGDPEVGPGKMSRFELYFPLPDAVSPEDLAGFEFSWALEIGAERMLTATTFETARPRARGHAAASVPSPTLGLR
jgi:hypothetical protein